MISEHEIGDIIKCIVWRRNAYFVEYASIGAYKRKTTMKKKRENRVADFFKNIIEKFLLLDGMTKLILVTAFIIVILMVVVIGIAMKKNNSSAQGNTSQNSVIGGNASGITGGAGNMNGVVSGNGTSSVSDNIADSRFTGDALLKYTGNTDGTYLSDCVFLGDSRYVAMYNYGYMPGESVLAKVGIGHQAALYEAHDNGQTLSEYLPDHQAAVIYIGYGVNSTSLGNESFISSYKTFIEKVKELSPASQIVICSIWPIDDNGRYGGSVHNYRIDELNDLMFEMAEEMECYFLDFTPLLSENGNMIQLFNSGDGLHYNRGAYTDIFEYIVSHPVPSYVRGNYYNDSFNYDYSNPENRVYYTTYYQSADVTVSPEPSISDNEVIIDTVSSNEVPDVEDNTGDMVNEPSVSDNQASVEPTETVSENNAQTDDGENNQDGSDSDGEDQGSNNSENSTPSVSENNADT